jgi:hypothetical protein
MPSFIEEIDVFVDRLKGAAESGEILRLEDAAIGCTVDVIGRAILYAHNLDFTLFNL